MARKFYKQTVHQIEGPGKKDINFLADKNEITEEEAQKILNEFFEPFDLPNSKEMRTRAWEHILKGTDVTVDKTCISYN